MRYISWLQCQGIYVNKLQPDNSHVSNKLSVLQSRISQTLIYTGHKIYDVDDNMACR